MGTVTIHLSNLIISWPFNPFALFNFRSKQLKQYFTEPSQEKLQSLAVEQVEKVGEEIQKLQDIQSFLFRVIETTNELSSVKTGEVLFQELPEEPIVLSTSNPIDSNTPVEEISRIVGEFLKGDWY